MKNTLKKIISSTLSTLHWILVALMIGIGFLAFFKPELIRGVIDWLEIQIKSWGSWNYAILFITAMAESFPFVGAVLPGMNIMILVGGFFIARQWEIFPIAVVLAMLGACAGNALGYFMGKYGDKKTLATYAKLFGAGKRELDWVEGQVERNGFWFIVVGKFHNLLRSFIPYIAGSHNFSGFKFWMANILGSSIWSVSILLFGIFFVENYLVILKNLNYIVFAAIIIGVFVYLWRQKKK